jgi:NarL family two-component system response regulator LiaR
MTKIRVLVVDDQKMVRFSLTTFLRAFDDLQAVGEATNGREALELCAKLHPDVVLMDIKMPDMDGITATRLIHDSASKTRVVLLTALREPEVMDAAQKAGVSEYILKTAGIEEIAAAIRRAYWNAPA